MSEWKSIETAPKDGRTILARQVSQSPEIRIAAALDLAIRYGGIDGDHHKAWVIDQMVRQLAGDDYDKLVAEACSGEDGPGSYEWDCGIAP